MKSFFKFFVLSFIVVFLSACNNQQLKLKKPLQKETLAQKTIELSIKKVNLHLSQKIRSRIKYHTQSELKKILTNSLAFYLDQNMLLNKKSKYSIELNVNYIRRFAGENKSHPTSSLAYPDFSYVLYLKKGQELVYKSKKNNITIDGGYSLNFQEKAGNLRNKNFEVEFVNTLVKMIIEDIKKFTK